MDTYYPESVQILYFYHAKEHLCDYAKIRFRSSKSIKDWIDKQTELMLNANIEQVMVIIKLISFHSSKEEKDNREKLLVCYQTNMKRMKYKTFHYAGYIIGSGAMEAATEISIRRACLPAGRVESFKTTMDEDGCSANSKFAKKAA